MGLLINGKWSDQWYSTDEKDGNFIRDEAKFRSWISPDTEAPFPAEKERYHLYVSYACPWAHRTLIFRALKGLEDYISVSVVHPLMREGGWWLNADFNGATGDSLYQYDYMHQLYYHAQSDISGRVTVPVLWDKQTETIVSNESSEIIRMFNSAFNHLTGNQLDFYPEAHRNQIDDINQWVYHDINNGVYKSGFATKSDVYEREVFALFKALDRVEDILKHNRYLIGDQLSEADWRIFPTLVRFDPVYVGHFKCNIKDLREYPNIWNYTKELYQISGIAETVWMDHIKTHYYASHTMINPTAIVPMGPNIDYTTAHNRGR